MIHRKHYVSEVINASVECRHEKYIECMYSHLFETRGITYILYNIYNLGFSHEARRIADMLQ